MKKDGINVCGCQGQNDDIHPHCCQGIKFGQYPNNPIKPIVLQT